MGELVAEPEDNSNNTENTENGDNNGNNGEKGEPVADADVGVNMGEQVNDAIVTAKKDSQGAWYLYVTPTYSVYPINTDMITFSGETRATAQFVVTDVREGRTYVKLVAIDAIETKALNLTDDPSFGGDRLDVVDDWRTMVEDGYLSVRFSTYWGKNAKYHDLRLFRLAGDDPYAVIIRQDSGGDAVNYKGDALVAFTLDGLPSTGGESVTLTLYYDSLDGGRKTKEFAFKN